jgi:aerobic-type carbon monoxide dehydrogenase small subunit (CoxS/CutS family)
VQLTVNGQRVEVDAHPLERLLDVLRERLGLTGTKEAAGRGSVAPARYCSTAGP